MCETEQIISVPKGSTTPVLIPYMPALTAFGFGKYPTILVEIVNDDGSTVDAPGVTVSKSRDANGFITNLYVNGDPSSTGTTADNLIVIIKK